MLKEPVAYSVEGLVVPLTDMVWVVPTPAINVNWPLISPALIEHDEAVAIELNGPGLALYVQVVDDAL
jgi:hypothetical protein